MALLASFAALVLAATAAHVAGQEGFLSIDCGLDAAHSGRRDTDTGITYVDDGSYVDGGINYRVAAGEERNAEGGIDVLTLRSFPSGIRNCYTLPTESGAKYLVRMFFFHGKYDGSSLSVPLQFDLHLGTNYWDTVKLEDTSDTLFTEALFVAWASWVPVCLVNIGNGTPFVNTVELRPLGRSLYPELTINASMRMHERADTGKGGYDVRFPDDPYDRYWTSRLLYALWNRLFTIEAIQLEDKFAVPNNVLKTGSSVNGTILAVSTWVSSTYEFMVFLHFTDFQNSQLRQFDVHINNEVIYQYSPKYLTASSVQSSGWFRATNGNYSVFLAETNISVLPPMINAYEIYIRIPHDTPRTSSEDFDAMMSIKMEYGVSKNWMGDPCFPTKYAWNGVKCSNANGNTARIISLDLSNSKLKGLISDSFTLLTQLQFLDLSGNSLNGPIPYTLCKKNARPLIFRYEFGEDMCNNTTSPAPSIYEITSPPPSKNKKTIISISIVVPVVVVVVLLVSCLIWRHKRKPKISTYDPPRAAKPNSVPVGIKGDGDHLQNTENRRFTYKELEKFTNKFKQSIGQGGFGLVYYGRLEDDTEVAIKMRSESSSHGLDEFLAEVNSLTRVHHRNLVSLVGYCWEKDHLALVYEYMSRGNLCDQLRGKNGDGETLSWGTRLQIVLESAQGLDYLHKGCNLPIIHRDVKTNNILLGQNMRAKIADFGLCKTYLTDMQTHISTNAAGSAGYMDPEYYHTGWLTERSDVYSFGVVLLEVATGEPPILPGHGHIVQRVKQKLASGNVSMVADDKLGGDYDVNSMWKLVDTAMACVADAAIQRPTMATVVAQLKESLALEESRENNSVQGTIMSTFGDPMSTIGPSTR